jgi:hypothetical protein
MATSPSAGYDTNRNKRALNAHDKEQENLTAEHISYVDDDNIQK